MNRARTFDPATALGQVVDLFASKGYSETSMEDIVQTTGVSRYGLYGTFGNKRELFEQALEQYAEGMGKQRALDAAVRSGHGRVGLGARGQPGLQQRLGLDAHHGQGHTANDRDLCK